MAGAADSISRRWRAVWADPDRAADLFAPDCVVRRADRDVPLRGVDEVRSDMVALLDAMPDLTTETNVSAVNGNVVFLDCTLVGTTPQGPVAQPGIDWFVLDDAGLVAEAVLVIDSRPFYRLTTPPPSRPQPIVPGPALDPAVVTDFAARYGRHLVEPSWDTGRAVIADAIVAYWPEDPEPFRGVDAAITRSLSQYQAVPDLELRPAAHAAAGDLVYIGWHGTAAAPDRRLELCGATRFRVRPDGLATEVRAFYDTHAADLFRTPVHHRGARR